MSEQQSDEEYVRNRWEHTVIHAGIVYIGDKYPPFETLAAARAFTEAREEEIRQVEREEWGGDNAKDIMFGQILGYLDAGYDGAFMVNQVRSLCILSRILARTQAHLETLKKGWKG